MGHVFSKLEITSLLTVILMSNVDDYKDISLILLEIYNLEFHNDEFKQERKREKEHYYSRSFDQ